MNALALPAILACAVLLPLHAHADAVNPQHAAAELRPAAAPSAGASAAQPPAPGAQASESPAAAFQRMFAHAPARPSSPFGAPVDPLTRAFNDALWDTPGPMMGHASVRLNPGRGTR